MNMMSDDAKAIVLLCGRLGKDSDSEPLLQSEYTRLVRWLLRKGLRPADLFQADNVAPAATGAGLPEARLTSLLQRGVQLGFAVESWNRSNIWVICRSDPDYPARYKSHLKDKAPPILFGVGDRSLLQGGGLAIVGSRNIDAEAEDFTREASEWCARGGMPVVSGGARGVDQIAMKSALDAGGCVIGILAENLLKKSVSRDARKAIADDRLLLISPYHPEARFTVGTAMARNKLIYAMADYGLVVICKWTSPQKKGGTWAGAEEELKRYASRPVFVRTRGSVPAEHLKLLKMGAVPFPEHPPDADPATTLLDALKGQPEQPAEDLFAYVAKGGQAAAQVREEELKQPSFAWRTGGTQRMRFDELVQLIEKTHAALQKRAVAAVDRSLCIRNWLLGMYIVEFEQHGAERAQYGAALVQKLADALKRRKMRGCSYRSLELFKKFYLSYRDILQTASAESAGSSLLPDRIVQTMSAQLQPRGRQVVTIPESLARGLDEVLRLSWSHYAFLVQIRDPAERRFYEIEAQESKWSVSELKRQFDTSLYERLALSRDKDGIRQLAAKGQLVERPADAIKEPYILEFLDLDEKAKYSESELEAAIINRIEHFLLELGKGFLFQSRQFRLTFDDQHFWVDLVFYNRLLRCFVLVDLKIGNATHQDLGQMQMYVNYFDREVKTEEENPAIGILLCKTKNDAVVEMTLPADNETIFASRYQLYLPSKDELRKQIRQAEEETA